MGAIDGLSHLSQVEAVYIGYFGRAGDYPGAAYWTAAMNSGFTLSQTGASFFVQLETIGLYKFAADYNANPNGPFTSDEIVAFITSIYQQAFNRPPDSAGLAYWETYLITHIAQGPAVVGAFIVAVLNGAVDVPGGTQDKTTLLNKITVATDWTGRTNTAGLNTVTANYRAAAVNCISVVTNVPASIASGEAVTTHYINVGPH